MLALIISEEKETGIPESLKNIEHPTLILASSHCDEEARETHSLEFLGATCRVRESSKESKPRSLHLLISRHADCR